jgi:LPS sulfotransferase NodH
MLLLYSEKYDFPHRASLPNIELMIASIPRSGSTALGLDLWRTGLLGAPLEYFNTRLVESMPRWAKYLSTPVDYWEHLVTRRSSPNGVFAYKLFTHDYANVMLSYPALLEKLAPSHVVYLTRDDLLEQSISYARASTSGNWFADYADAQSEALIDGHTIRERYHSIVRQMVGWEHIFEMTGAEVCRITYEEFLKCPSQVVGKVMRHVLGYTQVTVAVALPVMTIQRDKTTAALYNELKDVEPTWRSLISAAQAAQDVYAPAPRWINNGSAPSVRSSGISWYPERQWIFHSGHSYSHEGVTHTDPTHDLAHLFVAMCSHLLWSPDGDDATRRIAEYNAVFIEHLLSNVYYYVMESSVDATKILTRTLEHVRWFVQEHYAPFPLAPEEAYRQLCSGLNAGRLIRLAPYFFDQKARQVGMYKTMRWDISIRPASPTSSSTASNAFCIMLRSILGEFTSSYSKSFRQTAPAPGYRNAAPTDRLNILDNPRLSMAPSADTATARLTIKEFEYQVFEATDVHEI